MAFTVRERRTNARKADDQCLVARYPRVSTAAAATPAEAPVTLANEERAGKQGEKRERGRGEKK